MTNDQAPVCVRKLGEGDRGPVMELVGRDRVMGSLVHSFLVRRGLESSQEFWGLFGGGGTEGPCGVLAGLFTLDPDGRSTVLGGGPEFAGLIAEFMRERVATGAALAFIDAPRETAAAIAELFPPTETESLRVWAHDCVQRGWPAPCTELLVRQLDPQRDAPKLQELYQVDETFRQIGVSIGDALEAVRRGLRLMLVGSRRGTGGAAAGNRSGREEIVSSAFGWLTDLEVARVSGVVTHPRWRGRGYATAIVGELTKQLLAGGRQPFLYVSLENTPAVRVYERLGYRPHAVVDKLRYSKMRY